MVVLTATAGMTLSQANWLDAGRKHSLKRMDTTCTALPKPTCRLENTRILNKSAWCDDIQCHLVTAVSWELLK